MRAIFVKDLTQLFASPLAWVLLAVNQFVLAWIFLVQLDRFQAMQGNLKVGVTAAVISPLFLNAAIIGLFITPLLGMHGFAAERRDGALDLLLSSPASMGGIVTGRYLALLSWLLFSALLSGAMAWSLALGATLDHGLLLAGLLALLLCLALYAAISLLLSTLGGQPAAVAAAGIGVLLLLWLAGNATASDGLFAWLGLEGHFSRLSAGRLGIADGGYFVILTVAALSAAVFQLNRPREP